MNIDDMKLPEILNDKHLETTEWGQKLLAKFGEEKAKEFVEFVRENGFFFELPVSLFNMKLNHDPKVELKLLDHKGRDVNDEECELEIARTHLFVLEIDGKPLPYVKSVELSKLDYCETAVLTFKIEHYAIMGEPKLISEGLK